LGPDHIIWQEEEQLNQLTKDSADVGVVGLVLVNDHSNVAGN
jgi:hypothetical protein